MREGLLDGDALRRVEDEHALEQVNGCRQVGRGIVQAQGTPLEKTPKTGSAHTLAHRKNLAMGAHCRRLERYSMQSATETASMRAKSAVNRANSSGANQLWREA